MNNIAEIKAFIQMKIDENEKDIVYWERGQNLVAESIADKIAAMNEKLNKLMPADTINAAVIEELIKNETDDFLIIVCEDILTLMI